MDCAGILGCEKQRLFQKIPFTVGGRSFVSMEQYILYCKCLLAGNCGVAKKIMSMKDPAEISESGKEEIPGHRAEVWENALTDVLDSACRAVVKILFHRTDNKKYLLVSRNNFFRRNRTLGSNFLF